NKESMSSYKLFNNMRDDNDYTVNQEAVLTARLLDMLVADWDRHLDQWRWTTQDTGQGRTYIPIPRDRDQVFFHSDGLIVRFVSGGRLGFLKGLQNNIPKIDELNTVAKDFDRLFLNHIDENTWTAVATDFEKKLTDQKIAEAVQKLPPEIYAISGQKIIDKLISRRKVLKKQSVKYYKFLSNEVDVLGSNEAEKFNITSVNDSLKLTVYSYRKHADTNVVMYERIFDQKVTREIRLYGFNGDDKFVTDSNMHSTIRLRMIGGRGNDSFFVNSRLKRCVYDNIIDTNFLASRYRTKKYFNDDPTINEFEISHYHYPETRFPQLSVAHNPDDRFIVGAGYSMTRYGFRKVPHASEHEFSAMAGLTEKALKMKYRGELVQPFASVDMMFNVQASLPVLDNFFGFGNTTVLDESKHPSFYRVRYKFAEADILLRKEYYNKLNVLVGPALYHYWNDFNDNRDYILGKPS